MQCLESRYQFQCAKLQLYVRDEKDFQTLLAAVKVGTDIKQK